jgi:hypothetical protein
LKGLCSLPVANASSAILIKSAICDFELKIVCPSLPNVTGNSTSRQRLSGKAVQNYDFISEQTSFDLFFSNLSKRSRCVFRGMHPIDGSLV